MQATTITSDKLKETRQISRDKYKTKQDDSSNNNQVINSNFYYHPEYQMTQIIHGSENNVLQSTNCPNNFQKVDTEDMFTKEAIHNKDSSESDQCRNAGFISDICAQGNNTVNADSYSYFDINAKNEVNNNSSFTQELHDRRKDNCDILTLPQNIQQNEHFELTELDETQEMEEFKDRDFKWCDSLFDTYPTKLFENVLNDPELFFQDSVNKGWENGNCPTDSSELMCDMVLDNLESQESITHNVSGCDFQWNEEPEVENTFQSQSNEENNCGSAIFIFNGETSAEMCGDVINCPEEPLELQSNIICEDHMLPENREVNSMMTVQSDYDLQSSFEQLPPTQSVVLEESIPEECTIRRKKRKNQTQNGCNKRRKVNRRPKSKNHDEKLINHDHSQDTISKYPQQNKFEIKKQGNTNKRPTTKKDIKDYSEIDEEDYYGIEVHKPCDRDQMGRNEQGSDLSILSSSEELYLKNSSKILEDTTPNTCPKDSSQKKFEAMNSDNVKCSNNVESNSPLRMKINLVKKEVVYCGYKSKKSNLRRKGKRKYKRKKDQISDDSEFISHNPPNNALLAIQQGEVSKQQFEPYMKHKKTNYKKNNKNRNFKNINSHSRKKESSYCNIHSSVSTNEKQSVQNSLDCANYDINITPSPDTRHPKKSCDVVGPTDLSYVLTSESVLEDCVLTYSDVLNLDISKSSSNQDDKEIESCDRLIVCNEGNSSKSSVISEASQFSCDAFEVESDHKVNSENSLPVKEYSGLGWSDIHSSEFIEETNSLKAAVQDLQYSATLVKDVKHIIESKDCEIQSLKDKIDKYESNQLYKILEHVISEVDQSSIDEMSSASAIVKILMTYAEEKKL